MDAFSDLSVPLPIGDCLPLPPAIKLLTMVCTTPKRDHTRCIDSLLAQDSKAENDILLCSFDNSDHSIENVRYNQQKTVDMLARLPEYTHFLNVGSDIILPKFGVRYLLEADKDVVCGIYRFTRGAAGGISSRWSVIEFASYHNSFGLCWRLIVKKKYPVGLMQLAHGVAPGGCMMVKAPVLQAPGCVFDTHGDISFSLSLAGAGYKVWLDTRVACEHIPHPEIPKGKRLIVPLYTF